MFIYGLRGWYILNDFSHNFIQPYIEIDNLYLDGNNMWGKIDEEYDVLLFLQFRIENVIYESRLIEFKINDIKLMNGIMTD